MTTFQITDNNTDQTATFDTRADDLAAVIGPWYPEAPAEVTDAIADLERQLTNGEHPAAAAFLDVKVERA